MNVRATQRFVPVSAIGGIAFSWLAFGCGDSPTGETLFTDASIVEVSPNTGGIIHCDGGAALRAFTPPSDPGPKGILVSASGEVLALSGFAFPPRNPANDTYMVDGWNFVLTRYLTVFDHVVLWDNPNEVPSDPSQHGAQVAHVDGPWVVDLHKGGPLAGQGGAGEEAVAIATMTKLDNGHGLDTTATYGFGFSTVAAPSDCNAFNVNLDPGEDADYAYMVANGYSVLYVGTATWAGGLSTFGCTQTQTNAGGSGDAGADAGDGGYDFTKIPPTMTFRLGFSTPTNYVNCQNERGTGQALPGEDYPRGIQVSPSQSVPAQVTIHMDHPFWESFAENSPLHWDPIAAQFVGAAGIPEVHTEDLKGVNFLAFTDKQGAPLPWRNCAGTFYTPPASGQMRFDPLTVPVNPNAPDPSVALRDYYDFMRHTQSTQGHLNSQGLCVTERQFPSPPGGS
jgi:hypothetical protein